MFEKLREKGISLRAAHAVMIVIAVTVTVVLMIETYRSSVAFRDLSGATDEYIALQKAANELMEASDFLTQEVQSFTVTYEKEHMDSYFVEAESNRRREKSLDTMLNTLGESEAYNKLRSAMDESLKLMETEYYSMALVCTAKGYDDIPDIVKNVRLSADDTKLSPTEKISRAQFLVHDTAYHASKEVIRYNMDGCIRELERLTRQVQDASGSKMNLELFRMRILIVILSLSTIIFLIVTTFIGINPILKGVEKIKEDSEIPVTGSYEFRYLARTYNDMYTAFKKNIANLNYHVSHDKLTGVYNRMGYDILSSNLDFSTTTVVMIDVDHFKEINDKYGHGVGDKVLQKLAAVLKSTFRSDDYICRIGGDEFVVFMMYTAEDYKNVVVDKIKRINETLEAGKNDLPPVSISAGVVYGKEEVDSSLIMKHVDEALYAMKEQGRKGCYFYVEDKKRA
ncbi:MAG: GGDEF domain-containing protein [Lachnospiraceae bacterium]|nr:GGDEF domain-containing protein [Lachnospiraceae bacterium]